MAAPISLYLFVVLALLFQSNLSFSNTDQTKDQGSISDIHDLLPQYGLPKGILPHNVKSYTLSADTDKFTVELESSCYIQFADLIHYEKNIGGILSYGAVHELYGIQVKKLFVWLPVSGLVADEDRKNIEFQVGVLSEKLPTSIFAEIRSCRRN